MLTFSCGHGVNKCFVMAITMLNSFIGHGIRDFTTYILVSVNGNLLNVWLLQANFKAQPNAI